MLKTCTSCKTPKPLTEFAKKLKSYNSQCKTCKNNYTRSHYKENKLYYDNKKQNRESELKEFIRSLKLKCKNCPETHPACLHFHHLDPSVKEINMSSAAKSGWSRERILKEVSKCDILCANCHAKEHYDESHS